jgi:hypothetical protein
VEAGDGESDERGVECGGESEWRGGAQRGSERGGGRRRIYVEAVECGGDLRGGRR